MNSILHHCSQRKYGLHHRAIFDYGCVTRPLLVNMFCCQSVVFKNSGKREMTHLMKSHRVFLLKSLMSNQEWNQIIPYFVMVLLFVSHGHILDCGLTYYISTQAVVDLHGQRKHPGNTVEIILSWVYNSNWEVSFHFSTHMTYFHSHHQMQQRVKWAKQLGTSDKDKTQEHAIYTDYAPTLWWMLYFMVRL